MNVYEKLKTKYRKQLDKHVELYPSSFEPVKEDLLKNEYVMDLKYETFSSLNGMDIMVTPKWSMFEFLN
tara:strand:- start:35 stop:241 length:207 start_codon:yes stop_codon:yes gene_type:complete